MLNVVRGNTPEDFSLPAAMERPNLPAMRDRGLPLRAFAGIEPVPPSEG